MKAMILAAGKGTRMGKVSNVIPKPLTKINNYTLIEHNLLNIKKSGINEVIINISWLGNMIKDYLGDGRRYNIKIKYSDETSKLLGTGGGIKNALSLLGRNPFWLINADLFTDFKINKNFKLKDKSLCHLILVNNPPHNMNGDFSLQENKIIMKNKNKKSYTFSGISVVSPKLFDGRVNKKFALEPLLRQAAKERKVTGELYQGIWSDIGTRLRLSKILKYK